MKTISFSCGHGRGHIHCIKASFACTLKPDAELGIVKMANDIPPRCCGFMSFMTLQTEPASTNLPRTMVAYSLTKPHNHRRATDIFDVVGYN